MKIYVVVREWKDDKGKIWSTPIMAYSEKQSAVEVVSNKNLHFSETGENYSYRGVELI